MEAWGPQPCTPTEVATMLSPPSHTLPPISSRTPQPPPLPPPRTVSPTAPPLPPSMRACVRRTPCNRHSNFVRASALNPKP